MSSGRARPTGLGENCGEPSPRHPLATAGPLRVLEYRCRAERGAPPQGEAFGAVSIAIARAGTVGFRTDSRRSRLLSTGFLLLGAPGQAYEVSHEHGGGDRCLVFEYDESVWTEVRARWRPRRHGPASAQVPFGVGVLPPLPALEALRL